jgi:hypothetical protein
MELWSRIGLDYIKPCADAQVLESAPEADFSGAA